MAACREAGKAAGRLVREKVLWSRREVLAAGGRVAEAGAVRSGWILNIF